MENSTKKIVIFNELKSPRIEQAIFILRDSGCTEGANADAYAEADAVDEAERLVDAYLGSLNSPLCSEKKRRGMRAAVPVIVFSVCSLIIAALFMNILR